MKESIKNPGIIVVRNRNISLETQVVLLIFLIERETLNVRDDPTENTSKHQKMVAFVRNCLVKMTLRLLASFCSYDYGVPTLPRHFRILLQIKKIITNVPRVLCFAE